MQESRSHPKTHYPQQITKRRTKSQGTAYIISKPYWKHQKTNLKEFMKKYSIYQLYLSGVISENQYQEASEDKENIIHNFILETHRIAMEYCSSNTKVLTKVKAMIKRIDPADHAINLPMDYLVNQIEFVLEGWMDLTIPQVQNYLDTGSDDDNIIKYYPDFGKEDFELYIKTLNAILSKAKQASLFHGDHM